MPVDTSMYDHWVQPATPANPLQTMGQAASIQNVLNQNKLFQQEYNSKLGLSQIYKEAVDPATGQLDPNKVNRLLADPQASGNITLGLPQAIQNSQEAQQRQNAISAQQITLAKQHFDTLESYVAPLAANPNVTSKDILGSMSQAISLGHVDPKTAAGLYSSLPRDQQGNIDESQVPGWLKQQQFRMLDLKQQFDAMNPAPSPVGTGAQTHFIRTPQVGQPSDAGVIANTLPPSTTTVGPGNTPQYLGPQSSALQVPGQPQNTPAPQPQASPLAGAISGAPAAPAGAGNGAVQAGLAPGVADAAGVQAHTSAQQGASLQQRADIVPQTKAVLGNLEGALKQFGAGPGAGWKQVAKSFVNANSPFGNVFDPKTIASQEEFNKQAVMLAQQQFQALGGTGTDAKLDSASHTSPNDMLTPLGNRGIIQMLKGNEDAIAVKNREWQAFMQSGHGPQDYGKFSTQFNKEYDPRIFQSVYMDGADRKKMISGMTKAELSQFKQQYNAAVAKGWIPAPGQNNGG
jgi:hypothetical protein